MKIDKSLTLFVVGMLLMFLGGFSAGHSWNNLSISLAFSGGYCLGHSHQLLFRKKSMMEFQKSLKTETEGD